MFSTNAVAADTLIANPTGPLRLQYVQDLLLSSPLPPMAVSRNTLKLAMRATRKCKTVEDWRVSFWNLATEGAY